MVLQGAARLGANPKVVGATKSGERKIRKERKTNFGEWPPGKTTCTWENQTPPQGVSLKKANKPNPPKYIGIEKRRRQQPPWGQSDVGGPTSNKQGVVCWVIRRCINWKGQDGGAEKR